MYAATQSWCCEIGSVYRNGRCQFPERLRSLEASGPTDPIVPLAIVGFMLLTGLAWYEHNAQKSAWARSIDDAIAEAVGEARAAENAARRINQVADEADEVLRRFHNRSDKGTT